MALFSDLDLDSGGWLSLIWVFLAAVTFVEMLVFYRLRAYFPINKRSPTSSLFFSLCCLVSTGYMTYTAEFGSRLSCRARLGEFVGNMTFLLGGLVRTVSFYVLFATTLFIVRNRKRRNQGRPLIRPGLIVRNAHRINNMWFLGAGFIVLEAISVVGWYGLSEAVGENCSDEVDRYIKYVYLVACMQPFGMLYTVRKFKKPDPMHLYREGLYLGFFALVGVTSVLVLKPFDAIPRSLSDSLLIFPVLLLATVATLGMPISKVTKATKRVFRGRDSEFVRSSTMLMSQGATTRASNLSGHGSRSENTSAVDLRNLNLETLTLKKVLKNEANLLEEFLKFSAQELSMEGPEYLLQMNEFFSDFNEKTEINHEKIRKAFNDESVRIYETFFTYDSAYTVNVEGPTFTRMKEVSLDPSNDEETDQVRLKAYRRAYREVYNLVSDNAFKRYRRHLLDRMRNSPHTFALV